ncbi:hypothetical protein CspHIS471_0405600 [Cutaneotrichosporon sp. HIS471]|nr:hypothetical protein CspHIS471_0405600 [Cutaneotrichosporon sp. HIS471]
MPGALNTKAAPPPSDPAALGMTDAEPASSESAMPPTPAVVNTTGPPLHVFPRRFLGPRPLREATSTKATEARDAQRELRRKGMRQLLQLGKDDVEDEAGRVGRVVHRVRVRRMTTLGDETEADFDVDDTGSSSDSTDDEPAPKKKKKNKDPNGKGKGKDKKDKKGKKAKKDKANKKKGAGTVWVGNSFDIGAEFDSVPRDEKIEPLTSVLVLGKDVQDSPEASPHALYPEEDVPTAGPSTPLPTPSRSKTMFTPSLPSRVGSTSSTGGETFMTARDGNDDSDASTFHAIVPHHHKHKPPPSDGQPSTHSSPIARVSSGDDSRANLIISSDEEMDLGPSSLSPRSESQGHKSRGSSSTASVAKNAMHAVESGLKTGIRAGLKRGVKKGIESGIRSGLKSGLKSAVKDKAKEVQKSAVKDRAREAQKYNDVEHPHKTKTVKFKGKEPSGAQPPAHPRQVLARSGPELASTSQDTGTEIDHDVLPGGVVMRDRACVKVGRHLDESIRYFDESVQRRSPCYRVDPMEEYLLGMTVTSVDFYSDWFWPLEERIKGHKRLAHCVPLSSPTTLTVFHKPDMTLALVCPWQVIFRNTQRHANQNIRRQTSRWDRRRTGLLDNLHLGRQGCAIFLITFGERSRALDWYWYITGQLGLKLPPQIDIHVPVIELTLRIAIPEDPSSVSFNAETILRSAWKAVLSNTEQQGLLRDLGTVPNLQLAWKEVEPTLDWVCWDTTVTNRPRQWSLLASFAQGFSRPKSTLQIRDATHHGIRVRLDDGTLLGEPEAVEGYLVRQKTAAKPKMDVYLCVADGHIFCCAANAATPPLTPRRRGSSPAELFPELQKQFLDGERRRLATIVEKSAGCLNLSHIESVKLLKTAEPTDPEAADGVDAPPADVTETDTASPPAADARQRSKSVAAPQASEITSLHIPKLQRAETATHVAAPRRRQTALTPLQREGKKNLRAFEVTMHNGTRTVFVAHTPEIAAEWVRRLTDLGRYWALRRRVDARSAMNVRQLHMGREAFVGQAQDVTTETVINQLWNWCVIDGCRPVTHSGRVYVRRSPWGKFRSLYLVLMQGSLVAFASDGSGGMQNRRAVWPLFGSFVYSGMLAQDELDANENEQAWDPKNRMYMDGLQSADGAEDTTFCVRILWPHGSFAPPQPWDMEENRKSGAQASFTPPPLRTKPLRLLVCRARSKLERDRWVWALNCEKERFARTHVRDEETLRNSGALPRHSTLTHTNASLNL